MGWVGGGRGRGRRKCGLGWGGGWMLGLCTGGQGACTRDAPRTLHAPCASSSWHACPGDAVQEGDCTKGEGGVRLLQAGVPP